MSKRKIVQIIPAPRWNAVFFKSTPGRPVQYKGQPLVGWALLNDGTVTGLSAKDKVVYFCEDADTFHGYAADDSKE